MSGDSVNMSGAGVQSTPGRPSDQQILEMNRAIAEWKTKKEAMSQIAIDMETERKRMARSSDAARFRMEAIRRGLQKPQSRSNHAVSALNPSIYTPSVQKKPTASSRRGPRSAGVRHAAGQLALQVDWASPLQKEKFEKDEFFGGPEGGSVPENQFFIPANAPAADSSDEDAHDPEPGGDGEAQHQLEMPVFGIDPGVLELRNRLAAVASNLSVSREQEAKLKHAAAARKAAEAKAAELQAIAAMEERLQAERAERERKSIEAADSSQWEGFRNPLWERKTPVGVTTGSHGGAHPGVDNNRVLAASRYNAALAMAPLVPSIGSGDENNEHEEGEHQDGRDEEAEEDECNDWVPHEQPKASTGAGEDRAATPHGNGSSSLDDFCFRDPQEEEGHAGPADVDHRSVAMPSVRRDAVETLAALFDHKSSHRAAADPIHPFSLQVDDMQRGQHAMAAANEWKLNAALEEQQQRRLADEAVSAAVHSVAEHDNEQVESNQIRELQAIVAGEDETDALRLALRTRALADPSVRARLAATADSNVDPLEDWVNAELQNRRENAARTIATRETVRAVVPQPHSGAVTKNFLEFQSAASAQQSYDDPSRKVQFAFEVSTNSFLLGSSSHSDGDSNASKHLPAADLVDLPSPPWYDPQMSAALDSLAANTVAPSSSVDIQSPPLGPHSSFDAVFDAEHREVEDEQLNIEEEREDADQSAVPAEDVPKEFALDDSAEAGSLVPEIPAQTVIDGVRPLSPSSGCAASRPTKRPLEMPPSFVAATLQDRRVRTSSNSTRPPITPTPRTPLRGVSTPSMAPRSAVKPAFLGPQHTAPDTKRLQTPTTGSRSKPLKSSLKKQFGSKVETAPVPGVKADPIPVTVRMKRREARKVAKAVLPSMIETPSESVGNGKIDEFRGSRSAIGALTEDSKLVLDTPGRISKDAPVVNEPWVSPMAISKPAAPSIPRAATSSKPASLPDIPNSRPSSVLASPAAASRPGGLFSDDSYDGSDLNFDTDRLRLAMKQEESTKLTKSTLDALITSQQPLRDRRPGMGIRDAKSRLKHNNVHGGTEFDSDVGSEASETASSYASTSFGGSDDEDAPPPLLTREALKARAAARR